MAGEIEDRGDTFIPTDVADTAAVEAEAAAKAAAEAEALKATKADEEKDKPAEDPVRGADGKFAKKDKVDEGDEVRMKLEGDLSGTWVTDLEECWQTTRASLAGKPACLDLTGVTRVDDERKLSRP